MLTLHYGWIYQQELCKTKFSNKLLENLFFELKGLLLGSAGTHLCQVFSSHIINSTIDVAHSLHG